MDPSQLPLGQIFGGALTLGGVGLIIRMVIHYQRDFTEQYRAALAAQAARIEQLETKVGEMEARERRLQSRLLNCNNERAALRTLVHQNGLPWNPEDWVWHDEPDDPSWPAG
jgi:hypothetical protein